MTEPSGTVSVRYMVDDVEEAVAFYTKVLDFEVLNNFAPVLADVARGNLRLLLSGPTSSAGRPMPDGAKPGPGGWNRIHLIVDDIDAEVARLRDAGAQFRNDIIEGPGGKQILRAGPVRQRRRALPTRPMTASLLPRDLLASASVCPESAMNQGGADMPQGHVSAHELGQLPPFAHLSKEELRRLERLRTSISLPPGKVLARQGHRCLEFGIVIDGHGTGDPRWARDRPPRVRTALRRDRDRSCRRQPGDDRGLHCRDTGGHECSGVPLGVHDDACVYEPTSMSRSIAGSRPGWIPCHPFPPASAFPLSCLRTTATPWHHDASSRSSASALRPARGSWNVVRPRAQDASEQLGALRRMWSVPASS